MKRPASTAPLRHYCQQHTTPPHPVLREVERSAGLYTLSPQMVSGSVQGQLLAMMSRMLRPERVLEVGTFVGYGAICLAQGLAPGGQVHTLEVNDELAYLIRRNLAAAQLTASVTLHLGDAARLLPTFPDRYFQLAFLDAGKRDYPQHYELVLPKLRAGGFLLIDNVLWGGKVVGAASDTDTVLLRQFNAAVQADGRVDNVLLPLRDGLLVVRKR